MRQWLDTPAGVIGVLGSVVAIVTALLKLGEWKGKLESATNFWEWRGKIDANIEALGKVVTEEIKTDIRDMRKDIRDLREEMKTDIQDLREEMKTDIQDLREEMKTDIHDVRKQMKTDIHDVRKQMKTDIHDVREEIKTDIRDIRDKITEIVGQVGRATAVPESPRRLTAFGQEVADALGAQAWAEQEAKTDDQLPITDFPVRGMKEAVRALEPFQLDEFVRSYVHRVLRKDLALSDRVAACAYEFGIEQDRVIEVLRIVLRDELLDRP